jgi:hypothetical protein
VFWVDVITKIDLSITILIELFHDFRRDIIDIFTRPSTITIDNGEWTSTVKIFRIWTVFSSPFIFTNDDTIEDFTSIKRVISVLVTLFSEDLHVFSINVVT